MAVKGFETVTVSTTGIGLTAATYTTANSALITVESQAVRFRLDGTAPTSAIGHVLEAGDSIELQSAEEIQKALFIRRDGSDGTLRVTYFV